MKKIIYLLLFLFSSLSLLAQANLDSLLHLCAVYKDSNSDSLSINARKGIALAEKENNEKMLNAFYRYTGISCFQKQNYDTASIFLDKALKLAIKRKDRYEEASAYLATGYMYGIRSDEKLKIECMLKALPIFEEINDNEKTIEALLGITYAYRAAGNEEMALKYVNKAKDTLEKSKSENAFINALTYYEFAGFQQEIKKKVEYDLKALEYARVDKNKQLENLSNQALAYDYLSDELNDYDKALVHAKECYRIACDLGAKTYIYSALTILSTIYRMRANYKECEDVSLQAWAMDSTNLVDARELAFNLAIVNIHFKNEEKASDFLMKYESLTNEYTTESFHREMVEMEAKYEAEKKAARISTLEKERKLYTGLGTAIAVALLLGLGLLIYRHHSSEQKRKIAEQQIKQLEQEKKLIAAHAALNAETAERETIARDLHDGVGAMLSVVKNNMNLVKSYSFIENEDVNHFNRALDGLDKSIMELRRVAHHIMPIILIKEGLSVALDDFCRSIPEAEYHFKGIDRRFDSEKEITLYRCAYELVNNAMRHAKAFHIDVHLNMDENTVYLSVVDNGIGFDTQTTTMGMGINNLRTRLSAFGGRMDIYSEPEKGTEVNIEMEG